MRFFTFIGVISMALTHAPLRAEEPDIVVNGDIATTAEVTMLAPGRADLAIGPLYGVFLETVPAGVSSHMTQTDESGHGQASVAKWRNTPYADARICWRETGRRWSTAYCGKRYGTMSVAEINIGARRNEMIPLIPMALDERGGHVAWVAHPENTKVILDCGGMVSLFVIDADGNIRIADENERQAYRSTQRC